MNEFLKELLNSFGYLIVFISLVISFLYLLSTFKKVREFVYKQKYSIKEKLIIIFLFGLLGIFASEFGLKLVGVTVNARDCIAVFAGILGGPIVGIFAGLISGLYRMTGLFWPGFSGGGALGSWTAVGCGLATIGAGFLGAWLSKYKNITIKKITNKQIWQIVGLIVLWEIIHLQVIVPLISPLYTEKTFLEIEKMFFEKLLAPMAFVNVIGIWLFIHITKNTIIRREIEMIEKEMIEAETREKEIREKN